MAAGKITLGKLLKQIRGSFRGSSVGDRLGNICLRERDIVSVHCEYFSSISYLIGARRSTIASIALRWASDSARKKSRSGEDRGSSNKENSGGSELHLSVSWEIGLVE